VKNWFRIQLVPLRDGGARRVGDERRERFRGGAVHVDSSLPKALKEPGFFNP
jgi:hypothetical protein